MSLAPVSIGTAVQSASGGGVTGLAYGRAPTDRRHTLPQVDARTRRARAGCTARPSTGLRISFDSLTRADSV
jgi:hypothetical protein